MLTAAAPQAPAAPTAPAAGGPVDGTKDTNQKKNNFTAQTAGSGGGTNGININNSSNNSTSTKDNSMKDNSDDEDNMWDVDMGRGIGDLIIDLDADIERDGSSTGRQSSTTPQRNNNETSKNSQNSSGGSQRLSNNGKANTNHHHSQSHQKGGGGGGGSAGTGAATGAKNPFPNLTEAVMPGRLSTTGSQMPNGSGNSGPITTTATSSSSSSSVSSAHHHAGKTNLSSSSTGGNGGVGGGVQAAGPDSGTASLKMKIKRKSIGGKSSETKHEIVPNNETMSNTNSSTSSSGPSGSSVVGGTGSGGNSASVTSPYAFERNSNSPKSLTSSSVINNNSEDAKEKNDKSSNNQKHHASSKNKSGGLSHHHKPKHHEHHRERRHSSSSSTVNDAHNNDEHVPPNLSISERSEVSNIHKRDNISEKTESGTQTSIGTMTEADCLGPCEPGTSVSLSGIVWQELLEGGLLTLNVTWREKSYVGTLLDASRHDWAPPRLCDSPSSDIDSKSLKMTRGKRTRSNLGLTEPTTSKLRSGKGRRTANSGFVPPSPAKSDSSTNGGPSSHKKKARPSELELSQTVQNSEDESKRSKLVTTPEITINTNSPNLLDCPESGCSKKFKNLEGLRYHQSYSHPNSFSDINSDQDELHDGETQHKNLDNEDSSQESQPTENGTFKPIQENDKDGRPSSPAYSDISDEDDAVQDKNEVGEIKNENDDNRTATLPQPQPVNPAVAAAAAAAAAAHAAAAAVAASQPENVGAALMDLQNFANPTFEQEKKEIKIAEVKESPSKVVPALPTPVKPDEGVKPTMETQGPPPPTNGNYYYNRSFMPSFPPMSPYDYAMRGNAGLMGGPFSHQAAAAAMLHSQMRFPGMDPAAAAAAGFPMRQPPPPPPPQQSQSQPPSSGASGKGHGPPSSFQPGQKQPSALSPRDQPPRAPQQAPPHIGNPQPPAPGSLPRPHPSIHPNSHVGYSMFDPYSAMIVNHGSNPFGPK